MPGKVGCTGLTRPPGMTITKLAETRDGLGRALASHEQVHDERDRTDRAQLQHHSVPLATLTGPAFPSTSSAGHSLHRGGCTVVATENTVWCVLVVSLLSEVVETTRSLEPQLTPCRRRAWQSRMHRLDPTAGHVKNDCKPTELLFPNPVSATA